MQLSLGLLLCQLWLVACFLWSLVVSTSVGFAQGFLLTARTIFTMVNALCFLSSELLQIDFLKKTFANEYLENLFGDSVSVESRVLWNAFLPNSLSFSKTGPMRSGIWIAAS